MGAAQVHVHHMNMRWELIYKRCTHTVTGGHQMLRAHTHRRGARPGRILTMQVAHWRLCRLTTCMAWPCGPVHSHAPDVGSRMAHTCMDLSTHAHGVHCTLGMVTPAWALCEKIAKRLWTRTNIENSHRGPPSIVFTSAWSQRPLPQQHVCPAKHQNCVASALHVSGVQARWA